MEEEKAKQRKNKNEKEKLNCWKKVFLLKEKYEKKYECKQIKEKKKNNITLNINKYK